MVDQVSIWRWQIEGDLEAQFHALITAPEGEFAKRALQFAGDDFAGDDLKGTPATRAQTEARIRAMGLPEDVLQTTLEGYRAMLAEEDAAQGFFDDAEDDGYDWRGGDGRVGASLASSHMFFDDPYAMLDYEEIDDQVQAALERYKAAVSKAIGHAGQVFAQYLGTTQEKLNAHDGFEALMAAGTEGVLWVWEKGDYAYVLTHWQEDSELPIDLEFHRFKAASLQALRGKF